MTPTPEFRENSRERGARSPAYCSQRFDPPSRAQTFAEQSGKVCQGAGRVEGLVGSLERGRTARSAAGVFARGGRQTAEPRRRAGSLGQQRGHVAAAAGLLQQPGKRAERAAGANVGPNLGGSRASQAVPNLPGLVCGQKRGRRGTGGAFFRRAGERAAFWQKYCDPPPQKATQTPYRDHGSRLWTGFAYAHDKEGVPFGASFLSHLSCILLKTLVLWSCCFLARSER